ncbi:MAG: hypothetical protein QOH97_2972 [Actinoplanes sp.]|nr:hypothetical protein [Actinoplanes sp.]
MARDGVRDDHKAWTVAGAARFAREARTQTVLHLARAQTPVVWQTHGLAAAFNLWLKMYGTRQAAAEKVLAPMGYPPPYSGMIDKYAERYVRDSANELGVSSLFVVSPAMNDVVVAAAETLSLDDLNRVDEADLPTPAGLVVLPSALLRVNAAGDVADVRAIMWSPTTFHQPNRASRPGVCVTTFIDTYGPVHVASFDRAAEQARMHGEPFPPLILGSKDALPFHHDMRATPLEMDIRASLFREDGETGRKIAEASGIDTTCAVGEYLSGAPVSDPEDTLTRRYLMAFWRLCEQRVAEVEQADIPHSAIATAKRARTSPDVSVVTLRERRRVRDDPESGNPVQWTSRWIVRMHKVEQWYPTLQTHRVLWRGPYVKGPDGLPVKQSAVSALVR